MKIERSIMIRVNTRGDDDVNFCLMRDLLDPWQIASQANHREIDNRIDAPGLELVQPRYGISNSLLFTSPLFRIILEYLRIQHEHVLVHQRGAELRRIDRPANCLNLRHGERSPRTGLY